jgi:hypothetical protein
MKCPLEIDIYFVNHNVILYFIFPVLPLHLNSIEILHMQVNNNV